MRIMTRRIKESLLIGKHVTVQVIGVKDDQVRLRIKAPDIIEIGRRDILEKDKDLVSKG